MMEFDSPVFQRDNSIRNGWANVYEYDGFQSIGILHKTREGAIDVSGGAAIYRIRVKVKHTAVP